MNDLVVMKNKQAVTTSLNVAEVFEKNHQHILEAIDNLTVENSTVKNMFMEDTYINSRGRAYRQILMNRDGFTLLAMGFTGQKALQFKLQYIDAFNQMENHIKNGLPETPEEKLLLTMDVTNRTVKRVTKVENRVTDLEENQTLAPGEYNYITHQVNKAVARYIQAHKLSLSNIQRSKLFKDINQGLNEVTGIKTRTQLRKKNFDVADEFINNWEPSTATLTVIKQLGGEAEGQTELV